MDRKTFMKDIYSKYWIGVREKKISFSKYDKNLCEYIFKKVSTRYELPNGNKEFGKTINSNPQKFFTKEILDKLDKCAKEEFMYGIDAESDE